MTKRVKAKSFDELAIFNEVGLSIVSDFDDSGADRCGPQVRLNDHAAIARFASADFGTSKHIVAVARVDRLRSPVVQQLQKNRMQSHR